ALAYVDRATEGERLDDLRQPVDDELVVESVEVPEPAALAVGLSRPEVLRLEAAGLEHQLAGRVDVVIGDSGLAESGERVAADPLLGFVVGLGAFVAGTAAGPEPVVPQPLH